jgi:hypothetical protein
MSKCTFITASCIIGTGDALPVENRLGRDLTIHQPSTAKIKNDELYLHFPILLHDLLLSCKNNATIMTSHCFQCSTKKYFLYTWIWGLTSTQIRQQNVGSMTG